MKWCESDAIATVMQALNLFFFLKKKSSTIFRIRFLSIVLVSENKSDDNLVMSHMIGARKIEDSRKRDRKAADLQRRGPRSSKIAKKRSAKQKVWEPLR